VPSVPIHSSEPRPPHRSRSGAGARLGETKLYTLPPRRSHGLVCRRAAWREEACGLLHTSARRWGGYGAGGEHIRMARQGPSRAGAGGARSGVHVRECEGPGVQVLRPADETAYKTRDEQRPANRAVFGLCVRLSVINSCVTLWLGRTAQGVAGYRTTGAAQCPVCSE